MEITEPEGPLAVDAMKDILMMYHNMATDYGGFGVGVTLNVYFDPLKYIDAKDPLGFVDLDVLHNGSAVYMVAWAFEQWSEGYLLSDGPAVREYVDAVQAGRLAGYPDVAEVLVEAWRRYQTTCTDESWFVDGVRPLYDRYVRSYFAGLSEAPDSTLRRQWWKRD